MGPVSYKMLHCSEQNYNLKLHLLTNSRLLGNLRRHTFMLRYCNDEIHDDSGRRRAVTLVALHTITCNQDIAVAANVKMALFLNLNCASRVCTAIPMAQRKIVVCFHMICTLFAKPSILMKIYRYSSESSTWGINLHVGIWWFQISHIV